MPVDLSDYLGTYFYHTCFHLPGFSDKRSSILFHTILDCTFRTFHADVCDSGSEFLSRHIQRFPLRVLGIIYTDPIVLVSEKTGGEADNHTLAVEHLCRSSGLPGFRIDNQYPKAVKKLKRTIANLERGREPVSWSFPWSSNAKFQQDLSRYNTRFPLGALKKKAPIEALEIHYSHFPNSFRQKPEGLQTSVA